MSLYVHKFDDDGSLQYQGKVLDCVFDKIQVQLFSFIDGSPTIIEIWDKSMTLAFYNNAEEMRRAYERFMGHEPFSSDSPWETE